MLVLEPNHIKSIESKIALAGIKNDSLNVDLTDHICCMVEEHLALGTEFKQAEKEVFSKIGILHMQAIEQETKLLTQNKITMKKRTIIVGLVSLVLMAAGFTMKQFHLMGAGITWGVGVLIAAIGFTLFMTIDRFSYEKTILERVNGIIGFLGAAAFIIGVGFNVLRMPLSFVLTWSGGLVLLVHYILNNMVAAQIKR